MKHLLTVGLTALAIGACAPAQTTLGPSPRPTDVPAQPTEPTQALAESGAPQNWWQLAPNGNRARGISATRAYQELLAGRQPRRTVVVAILDSGVDIQHEDLDDVLWVNEDEIPNNNIDDDRNGYVDDVHGWNFIGGRDGRNVAKDNLEVARLYGIYRRRFQGVRPDTLSAVVRREYEEYQAIEDDLEERREEAQSLMQQVQVLDQVFSTLRGALAGREMTPQNVSALPNSTPQVAQAKQIFAQISANGVTEEEINEAREYAQGQLEFALNPDFDPRPIVGDRYEDLNERGYGNKDVEGPDPEHGTHVAGIVAAERGNGRGIDGIAPSARIMVVRTVPDGDERDKDVANAIRYAVDNGAHVINMSFGKSYSPQKAAVDDAVRYAAQRNVLLVHGSGNDAANLAEENNFPNKSFLSGGEAANWIEVGASSWHAADTLVANFSNYGKTQVDVFAPGVDILSTVPNNEYEENSGTSMASPVVAGLAALIMAYYPELTAVDVKRVILDSSTKYSETRVLGPGDAGPLRFGDMSVTGGVVNAYAALQMAEQMAAQRR